MPTAQPESPAAAVTPEMPAVPIQPAVPAAPARVSAENAVAMRGTPDEDGWISITSEPVEEKDISTLVAAAMEKHAQMRLLVTGGYFDMSIPYLGSIYSVDHAGFDPARVQMAALESGHSPYDDEATLQRFAEHLRSFLRRPA